MKEEVLIKKKDYLSDELNDTQDKGKLSHNESNQEFG